MLKCYCWTLKKLLHAMRFLQVYISTTSRYLKTVIHHFDLKQQRPISKFLSKGEEEKINSCYIFLTHNTFRKVGRRNIIQFLSHVTPSFSVCSFERLPGNITFECRLHKRNRFELIVTAPFYFFFFLLFVNKTIKSCHWNMKRETFIFDSL